MIAHFDGDLGPSLVGIHMNNEDYEDIGKGANTGLLIDRDRFAFLFETIWGYPMLRRLKGKGVYEGERDEQELPHGVGVYTHKSGTVYAGEFRKGARHGFGVLAEPAVDPVVEKNSMLERSIEYRLMQEM